MKKGLLIGFTKWQIECAYNIYKDYLSKKDIGLDLNDRSVVYENIQARERTQILMDVANKENGIVIGVSTGKTDVKASSSDGNVYSVCSVTIIRKNKSFDAEGGKVYYDFETGEINQ